MATTYRKHWGGTTEHFWPDDTDDCFYLASDATLEQIIDGCQQRWPTTSMEFILIESKFIHTDYLGYDLMDWGDYTNFLCITNIEKEKG